ARVLAATRRHVWLQIGSHGAWRTMDPSGDLPLPQAGVQILSHFPASWERPVTVKVEVERLDDGHFRRETTLERRWTASALEGRAIEVVIVPDTLSEDILDAKAGKPALHEQA